MNDKQDIKMMTPITILLMLIVLAGGIEVIYRMTSGLGASSGMNDDFPWGLVLGFGVLGGVAMAAGGFLIAGAVYILNMKKYKPIVRPAILTAFLGYLLAITALFVDIGHPLRLWHPAVMWQIHSVMWVVAMHVILYTTTLAIEFSPMLFEKFGMTGAKSFVERIIMPVVLFGVMLSILHQSSLGAVFLIVPGKMSPLWFSKYLPYFFLVSAVMMGLSMVSIEAIISAKVFKHKIDPEILKGLARGSMIAIIIYLVMKLVHLLAGPGIGAIFDGSMEGNMYLLGITISAVVPLILFIASSKSTNVPGGGLVVGHLLVIIGILLNRLNVNIFGMYRDVVKAGGSYFPSGGEFLISLALVALGIVIFKTAAKYLDLFPGAVIEN